MFSTFFEAGRVTLLRDRSYGLMPDGLSWILVQLDIDFRAEMHWPGTVEIGLGVASLGRTSVIRAGGVLRRPLRRLGTIGLGAARRGDAKPTPMTEEISAKFQPWLRRGLGGK